MESSTKNTQDTALCNTKRSRAWCFTWNNYTIQDIQYLVENIGTHCTKYVFQEERGIKDNTKHLQGVVYFKNPKMFTTIKKQLPKCHLEPCRNFNASIKYCSKKNTRCGKLYTKGIGYLAEIKDPLEDKEFYPWQISICEILSKDPDDRTILWVVESKGNTGKTSLAKHLCLKYKEEILYMTGKCADIKYGVTKFLEKHRLRVAIFDYTRSIEKFVSYEGLENVKNGILYSTKYESGQCIFDSPHVLVFSNFKPETDKLSRDRWKIYYIKGFQLREYGWTKKTKETAWLDDTNAF